MKNHFARTLLIGIAATTLVAVGGATASGSLLLSIGAASAVPPPKDIQAEHGEAAEMLAEDLLGTMPVLPPPRPHPVVADPIVTAIAPGVAASISPPYQVLLTGAICLDSGPIDHGFETLVALRGGRLHESLIQLTTGDAAATKTACLAAFAWGDGVGSGEGDQQPARGIPVRVEVRWQDEEGRHIIVDASCLVRDRVLDRPFPPLPYIWTGSRTAEIMASSPDGSVVRRPAFMLAQCRVVVANEDVADALIASPLPPSQHQLRYEINTAIAPHLDQPVAVVLTPARLPWTCRLTARGELADPHGEILYDDSSLGVRLAQAFLGNDPERLHAVLVRVDSEVPRDADVRARLRIMRVAASVGVWCIPVFQPDGIQPLLP